MNEPSVENFTLRVECRVLASSTVSGTRLAIQLNSQSCSAYLPMRALRTHPIWVRNLNVGWILHKKQGETSSSFESRCTVG